MQRNITGQTLPTYRYIQNLLRHSAAIEGITERAANFVGVLRLVSLFRVLNYYLFAFQKPGGR